MVTVDDVQRLQLAGADVVGSDGRPIGSVGQLFLDAGSGEPAWVTVATGLFGRSESFVPLAGAVAGEHELRVGYDKDQVKHAPHVASSDGTLSPDEERDLFRHYGLGGHGPDDDGPGDRRGDPDGHDDRHEATVTGTERVPTERVRLRRYTVTENRTISVPVSREEHRIEHDVHEAQPSPAPGDESRPAGQLDRHDDQPDDPEDRPGGRPEDRRDGPRHRR